MKRPSHVTLLIAILCLLPATALAAGDVTGKVKKGDLILKGDDVDNRIKITGSYDGVVVKGLDGTRINGKKEVVFYDVERDLNIKLRDGDDKVVIEGLNVWDDLRIVAGKGRDTVIIYDVYVDDDFCLSTGKERDDIELEAIWVHGDAELDFGAAADDIILFDFNTDDDCHIDCGDGADDMEVLYCWFDDKTKIKMGDGDDDLWVGDGTIFWDDVKLDGGDDIDYLILGAVSFSFFSDVDFDDFEILSW